MAKEVHRNRNGVVILVSHQRGTKRVEVDCPACAQPSQVALKLDSAGKCLQVNWSCNCKLAKCRDCTDSLSKTISNCQGLVVKKDAWRFHIFCVHSLITDRHYKSEETWEVSDDAKEYFTRSTRAGSNAPFFGMVSFVAENTARKAMAPLEIRVASLEEWRLQETPGTGFLLPDSPPLGSGTATDELWLRFSGLLQGSGTVDSPMADNTTPEHRRLTPTKRPKTSGSLHSGAGHLAKGETPRDVQRLRALRDSDEGVEALVAARQVGGHFEISFDTSRALEKDSGWLLMVTGIHHIAFAARGDLDPTADDVFSVEDIGGIQRVISFQQKVAKEQRFMVPSGENDGTVLFVSTEEVTVQRLQRMVAGVRMGEVEDTCKGSRMAVCYSQAGFYSSEVVMAAIEDRASAERAAAEAWQEAASKRLDRLELETRARRERCRELAEAAEAEKQETERMRQQLKEQRTGGTEGGEMVQLSDTLALLERKIEKRLEEEQWQLARLEEAVKTEKKSLAERFRRELADKEEVMRVMTLHEHQLQEELMAEKERRLLEKEQREALQSDLAKKEAALQAAEVRLAVTRSENTALEAARQEQTGAGAAVVWLRCELAHLKETVAQFEARATSAEAMAEAEEARVATLQQNLADEKETAAETKAALAALHSEMKAAAKEKETLSEALDAEKNASAEAQSETEQLKAEVAQLGASVELHLDAAVALQLEKEALNLALATEKNASAEAQSETEHLKAEVAQLAAEVEQLQDAVAALQLEKRAVEQGKNAVEQEKEALSAALDVEKNASAEAQSETEQLNAEVAQLAAEVAQQQDAAAALQSEKETVEQEKEAVHQEKEAMAAQLEAQRTATAEAEATAAEHGIATLEAEVALALLREQVLHEEVLLLVEDAGEREAVARALEGGVEELTVTLPKETEANGKDCARLYRLLLTQCPGVQKLCLDSETYGKSIKCLAKGDLKKLHFWGTVTDDVVDYLAPGLEKNTGLLSLHLGLRLTSVLGSCHLHLPTAMESCIGDTGAARLQQVLATNRSLLTLWLGNTSIGDTGANGLAEALESNNTLETLILERSNIGDEGASYLAGALSANSALRKLSLTFSKVGDKGAEHFATALKQNRTLLDLALGGPNIGAEAARHLAGALKENDTLLKLSLEGSIGVEGARQLAKALKKKEGTLQKLFLGDGKFGNTGAQSLALALQERSALQELRMWNCGVGDEGAEALATALKGNSTLQTLQLAYSNVGDVGAGHLAGALEGNGTLRALDLRHSNVGQEGADLLAAAVQKKNKTFKRLVLPKGKFDERQRQHLHGIDSRIRFA